MFLKGRTAIVTGATRGIGRAIALKLAEEGANIVFNYLKSKDLADSLLKDIKKIGPKAIAVQADISDFDQVSKIRDKTNEAFGTFDILINNAGIIQDASLVMMSPDVWKKVIDTNLTGVFNMSKASIATFMKQKKGNIVNISSIGGIIGMPRQTKYSASKGGINAFTKSLAKEVAPYNVRVNAVAPGFIETEMLSDFKEEYKDDMKATIPLGRFGTAEEVASTVSFLLGENAQYITGQVIKIDGGLAI